MTSIDTLYRQNDAPTLLSRTLRDRTIDAKRHVLAGADVEGPGVEKIVRRPPMFALGLASLVVWLTIPSWAFSGAAATALKTYAEKR